MFFNSWALWEKMTFILALAILAVFGIGYLKLLWTNRLVKKQELVDEEKRMRIQELRNSGQIVESRKSYDVPFGVRAIQSGITVDGIWISQSSSPIPSELKLGHLYNASSVMVATFDSSKSADTVETIPQIERPNSKQGREPFRYSETGEVIIDQLTGAQEATATERPGSSGTRLSYKPRRSSHLRFGSHGEYDETTLDQLEGKSSPKKKIYTHRPRGSRQIEPEMDSASAADNERSSGTSDDSDATLSNNMKSSSRHSLLPQYAPEAPSTGMPLVPSSKPVTASHPLQSSRAEYFAIPLTSPATEISDPFATPMESPTEASEAYKSQIIPTIPGSSWNNGSQPQPLQHTRSSSTFVPGELHVNKTVRKVNSGFEVLPAGTFGTPAEFKGKGADTSHDEDSGERRHSKLQKKPRTSMTGRRPSGGADHS